MKICFIGYGNMAKAIARGLIGKKSFRITAAAPSLTTGVNQDNIHTYHDNQLAIREAQVIILAVKPHKMSVVLNELYPVLPKHSVLISVAAGLSLEWFAQRCPPDQAIIRTMPNTPAAIGLAATPMIANAATSSLQKDWAQAIFTSIGLAAWADDESAMDTFTALSGSGPAYVFLFIEALINAAQELGLAEPIARSFALQTVKGALELVETDVLSLSQLRSKVTSPGGTTAAALEVLHEDLHKLILRAMKAAKQRSYELGHIN